MVSGMSLPGFNIITLDPDSLSVKEQKFYNTHSHSAMVQSMITWLQSLVDGTLLIGCSSDEAENRMQPADWTVLVSIPIRSAVLVKTLVTKRKKVGLKSKCLPLPPPQG